MNKFNCLSCKYSNIIVGGVDCDRRTLYDGVVTFIPNASILHDCPCHSFLDLKAEETREGFGSLKRIDSPDVCGTCGRIVKDERDFITITIEENGEKQRKKMCRICKDKFYKTEVKE